MLDLRAHFSRCLGAERERLHFAAHSHHLWPDVTRDAQLAAWDLAARRLDGKWDMILGEVAEAARNHIASHLKLPDPATVVFAPNTHELLNRLLSCFPAGRPIRILATDGEFHSFARQARRLAEEGLVDLALVPVEPFASFLDRFCEAARSGVDLVWTSQVYFNSGFVVEPLSPLAGAAGDAMLVIDGYHGFLARPSDLSALASRTFYLAGGYKYAMAGEGVCFMHCPPGWGLRPRDTGWFAAFGALSAPRGDEVVYAPDGRRFMGATFDPSGLFRFNAAMDWLSGLGIDAEGIHDHAVALQTRFVAGIETGRGGLDPARLVVPLEEPRRGNFLTFEMPDAAELHERLKARRIVTDLRGTRLRVGFGLYHATEDVDRLIERLG